MARSNIMWIITTNPTGSLGPAYAFSRAKDKVLKSVLKKVTRCDKLNLSRFPIDIDSENRKDNSCKSENSC